MDQFQKQAVQLKLNSHAANTKQCSIQYSVYTQPCQSLASVYLKSTTQTPVNTDQRLASLNQLLQAWKGPQWRQHMASVDCKRQLWYYLVWAMKANPVSRITGNLVSPNHLGFKYHPTSIIWWAIKIRAHFTIFWLWHLYVSFEAHIRTSCRGRSVFK